MLRRSGAATPLGDIVVACIGWRVVRIMDCTLAAADRVDIAPASYSNVPDELACGGPEHPIIPCRWRGRRSAVRLRRIR